MNRVPTSRLRIAWVTTETPDLRGGGGAKRQAQLLAEVSRVASVDLFTTGEEPSNGLCSSLVSHFRVSPAVKSPNPSWWEGKMRALQMSGRRGPPECWDVETSLAPIAQLLRDHGPYQAILVEHGGLAPLRWTGNGTALWALSLQNLSSRRLAQQAAVAASGPQRWLTRRMSRSAARLERRVMRSYDLVTCTSEEDARALGPSAVVIPNGVDTGEFSASPLGGSNQIVFTGTLDFEPNDDGLTWFCTTVLPRVRKTHPSTRVLVAGRRPSTRLRQLLSDAKVDLVEDSPDIRVALSSAAVVVVPIRIGSGTRIKALEAMASGRPVVGTRVGMEGLRVVDGVHCLLRDSAEEFAEGISAALTNRSLAISLARNARQLIEHQHSAQAIASKYAQLLLTRLGAPVS